MFEIPRIDGSQVLDESACRLLVAVANPTGLPAGFDIADDAHLGLAIVRTIVEDDLRGTLAFRGGRGTNVAVTVPIEE